MTLAKTLQKEYTGLPYNKKPEHYTVTDKFVTAYANEYAKTGFQGWPLSHELAIRSTLAKGFFLGKIHKFPDEKPQKVGFYICRAKEGGELASLYWDGSVFVRIMTASKKDGAFSGVVVSDVIGDWIEI